MTRFTTVANFYQISEFVKTSEPNSFLVLVRSVPDLRCALTLRFDSGGWLYLTEDKGERLLYEQPYPDATAFTVEDEIKRWIVENTVDIYP